MTCDQARDANHHDLDDRLAPAARAPWEAHLAACAACRAHRAGLSRVEAAFAAAPAAAGVDLLGALGLAEAPAARPAAPAPVPLAAPRRRAAWRPLAGGLVAAALVAAIGLALRPGADPALVAAIGLTLRPGADPTLVAMSPSPAAAALADAEAILTWFDADADYVEPVVF